MPSERLLPTQRQDYIRLFSTLSRRAPRARMTYVFCDCPDVPVAENVISYSVGYADEADWPQAKDRWKGKTSRYTSLFGDVLTPMLTRPASRRRFG